MITDIAKCLIKYYNVKMELKEVGIRPGEKIHEEMISSEEWLRTGDAGDYYYINQEMDFSPSGKLPTSHTLKSYNSKNSLMGFNEAYKFLGDTGVLSENN